MQNSIKFLFLLLTSLVMLAACGQKGPLFLPGDPTEVRTVSQESQPRPERAEEDDDEIPRP